MLCAQSHSDFHARPVGTWKLVSAKYTMKDGSQRPYPEFGPNARGMLMYTADGFMCAQLVNPDKLNWKDAAHPTNDEKVATLDGTFSYCGRYEVDEAAGRIIHLPEIATAPNYPGSRQVRPFRLEGDKLILSGVETEVPDAVRWTIVWQRAK
jgi:hypothetical protein